VNPNRYRSKAAQAFSQEILPQFATHKPKPAPAEEAIAPDPDLTNPSTDSPPLETTPSQSGGT